MTREIGARPSNRLVLTPDGLKSERAQIEAKYGPVIREDLELRRLVSYVGNKSVPFLGLYRYKEAFSLEFVNRFLDYFDAKPGKDMVFDPFAGLGTSLFASMLRGIPSVGVEKLPIAAFAAKTLPMFFRIKEGDIAETFQMLKSRVDASPPTVIAEGIPILSLAFDEDILLRLRKWKTAIDSLESPLQESFLLLFFSILESTSYTSNDGQFLRLKRDKRPVYPDDALLKKVLQTETDIIAARRIWDTLDGTVDNLPQVYEADTRDLRAMEFSQFPTILITSPPYANRYDYTRSYCLELCFHFVNSFEELKAIRFGILRSHIESKTSADDTPAHPVVAEVVTNLSYLKLNNPRIPFMITAYFVDMEKAISEWSRVLMPGSKVALVVDNVRFEGEMVPVDLILSDIAEQHGFVAEEVIVARYKGNSSQQMGRYGRVPVRESVVVWRKL